MKSSQQFTIMIFLKFKKVIYAVCYFICLINQDLLAEIDGNSSLVLIKDNLYEDGKSNLYFRLLAVDLKLKDPLKPTEFYRSHLSYPEDDIVAKAPLNKVVDKESWTRVADFLYKDKKFVYLHTPMASGGFITVIEGLKSVDLMLYNNGKWHKEIEIQKFDELRTRKHFYLSSSSHIYFEGLILKEADPNTFRVIRPVDNLVSGQLAVDINNIYESGQIITKTYFDEMAKKYAQSKNPKEIEYSHAMSELIGKKCDGVSPK